MKHQSAFPDITEALAAIDVLAGCSRAQLAELAPFADVLTIAAGDVLARPRMVAREFLGILDGYVHETDDDGALRVLVRGAQIGADQLFGLTPHTTSLTAATTTTLVVVFGPAFRAAMRHVTSVRDRLDNPLEPVAMCPEVASLRGAQ